MFPWPVVTTMDNKITVVQPERSDWELRSAQRLAVPPEQQHEERKVSSERQELLEHSEPTQQWVAARSGTFLS